MPKTQILKYNNLDCPPHTHSAQRPNALVSILLAQFMEKGTSLYMQNNACAQSMHRLNAFQKAAVVKQTASASCISVGIKRTMRHVPLAHTYSQMPMASVSHTGLGQLTSCMCRTAASDKGNDTSQYTLTMLHVRWMDCSKIL